MAKTQRQTRQSTTTGVTDGDEKKCTCCEPPNILIRNPRIGEDKLVCPNTGHIYEDQGDGTWVDTGRTVEDFLGSQQPEQEGPGGGTDAFVEDVGGDRPSRDSEAGTYVDLHGRPFASES